MSALTKRLLRSCLFPGVLEAQERQSLTPLGDDRLRGGRRKTTSRLLRQGARAGGEPDHRRHGAALPPQAADPSNGNRFCDSLHYGKF